MSATCEREREEARELAKYEEDCKEYKVTLYLLAMLISIALAGLISGFLVPRTPRWYSLFCWKTALVFFSSAILFGLHTRCPVFPSGQIAKPSSAVEETAAVDQVLL